MENLRPSLRLVTARMQGSIEVKDRRINLRMYRRTFVAKDAVHWLVESKTCSDGNAAVQLCIKMINDGYVQSITRGKKPGFEANKDIFKFCVDLKPRRFTAVDRTFSSRQLSSPPTLFFIFSFGYLYLRCRVEKIILVYVHVNLHCMQLIVDRCTHI